MPESIRRFFRGAMPIPWVTVAVFALVMAYADGFVLTSIPGAVGAIERTHGPFASWLRTSTLMLPLFVLGVLAGLALARRRFGPALRTARKIVTAALLIVAAGTLVGAGELAVSAAYDYHLQSQQLELIDATHRAEGHVQHLGAGTCTGLCARKHATLAVDAKAVGYGSAVVLGANLVLVAWVLAMRGGRLEPARTRRAAVPSAV